MSPSPQITLRGFRPAVAGLASVLGELETTVMELLWAEPGQTVNQVERALQRKRPIAHTTVLTTLDRMYRKGYLTRRKQGKAFAYSPRFTAEEFKRGMAEEVLGSLLGQFKGPALSAFVDLVGQDSASLDRLEAIIREKRQEQAETASRKPRP
jgi:predicted transcriptional regulator